MTHDLELDQVWRRLRL